ncbi:DUF2599 domain-containing protein [Pseudomonas sp. 5P_5.1_Bac1]|uniref:DUF2599 domain-containing protein n=1 Tax=Pseudomonas sp. 5P_5.1_Bac1 TaxID=2971616 RepID=UPI0021C864E5|nr:DUF2599 domain-containing protein [Pseudomonas sp. 5P_5.1_Bac1]MCU1719739.1 DUF2599 domain-containing protein [Pseudomonas sp. 5P_5.1_Bac1]
MRRRIDRLIPLLALPFMLQATFVHAESCEETLKVVQELYNNEASNCMSLTGDRSVRNPASDCSGLLVRGTMRPERQETPQPAGTYYVWNSSPTAVKLGTTAASWMRSDIKYQTPGVSHHNGMLLYPTHYTPAGKTPVNIDCAFPIDGYTDSRNDNGCGDNDRTPNVEKSCQQEGVNGSNWKASEFDPFGGVDPARNMSLCGFDMRGLSDEQRTDAFQQFMQSRKSIEGSEGAFFWQTEVRFKNPEKDKAPVMAFFFSEETGTNVEDAWKNAEEYKQVTGEERPVIKINFPNDPSSKATFSCATKPAPKPEPVIEPDKPVAGGWGTGTDPKQCSQYIDSVKWISRWDPGFNKEVMSLSVTPTACGREVGPDQTEKLIAEMKQKALAEKDGAKYWGDRDQTLRRQAVCHITLVEKDKQGNDFQVRNKETWNLEPVRPYVSHEQSLRDGCNSVKVDGGAGGTGGAPAQCPDYIKSVKWMDRTYAEYPGKKIKALEVTYNDCALGFGPDKTDAVMAEMKRKALAADPQGAKYWGDKDISMRRQSICLAQKYTKKNPVYLESIRPNEASQEQVNAADCNHK